MNRIMVDIETLGTQPGCAILSIGACRFGLEGPTRGLDAVFSARISPRSNAEAGLAADPETVLWWMGQPEDARARLTKKEGSVSLRDALASLKAWVGRAEPDEVWAKGPSFDCVILDEAYRRVGIEPPWRYWRWRDVRTAVALSGVPEPERDGVSHAALDDALHQAEWVSSCLRSLQSKR